MEFDNAFEVPLPPDQAWPVLMDIRGIAPCMPGAQLTEVVDDRTYKGNIAVRLGPVALTFAGLVTFEEIDDKNHTARVRAQGTDAKGRGSAQAAATFRLEPVAAGSKVLVHTDLTLSGAVAQYGRGVGMIQATASALMNQFANALKAQLAQRQAAVPPPPTAAASAVPAPSSSAAPVSDARASPSPATASSVAGPSSAPTAAPASPAPLPAAAKPISGFSLMLQVAWDAIRRLFSGKQRS
jgi:carbon monoxide dehydrogenase subunit G